MKITGFGRAVKLKAGGWERRGLRAKPWAVRAAVFSARGRSPSAAPAGGHLPPLI